MDRRITVGHMTFQELKARDVDSARDEILNLLRRTSNGRTIYFNGWHKGLGTAAVLRSIAQVLESMKDPPPELCFSKIIYIDCSIWKSKRVMQRRIAEELMLDGEIMAMFEERDKEDDFNGVDPTYRDVILDVAAVIDRTLRESSFMMIFINGSDEEVVLSRLGIPEYHDHIIIWSFKSRFPTKGLIHVDSFTAYKEIASKLRNTNVFLGILDFEGRYALTSSENTALVHEEAASVLLHHPYLRGDDQAMVVNCYLYLLFLHHSFYKSTSKPWAAHGVNYWICDGIIQGTRTREISKALYQEISFEVDDTSFDSDKFNRTMMLDQDSPYLVFYDYYHSPSWINANRPRRWISITLKNMTFHENMKIILARVSSIFLQFEITNIPQRLPDDLIKQCKNLRVLILSNCAFNFISPVFGHCSTLRFLGLDHCVNNYTTELLEREDYTTKWAFMHSLWVLDLRYTNWDEILSENNMDRMVNIMELDIEGSMCWQYVCQLEGRLPYLQRLRIVKPLCQVDTSMETNISFIEKKRLELLDLSGNKDMKKLPTSLTNGSSLHMLILDGCASLENVILSKFFLRSFSFDGYGPASNWTSMDELPPVHSRPKCPPNGDMKDVKISLITLEGCTQLKNLFLRGLPNLVELDLSGCAIKILDFETMVVDVPRLKRLFLLGCEHLCAIRWGLPMDIVWSEARKEMRMPVDLELLCIDTRPDCGVHGRTRPSIAQDSKFKLQVNVITADARLVRALYLPLHHAKEHTSKKVVFDICICTSSKTSKGPTRDHQQHHLMSASLHNDVSIKVEDYLNPVQDFPKPPASQLDRHIEIGHGNCSVQSEVEVLRDAPSLAHLMKWYVQSLHVHDASTSVVMPQMQFRSLVWCRVERCPSLDHVFPPSADPQNLETIWASDLLMARCIWSKGQFNNDSKFGGLLYLHLRSCPSLQFALPVWTSSFPKLESLHIMHCSSLRHVFALDNKEYNNNSSIRFPKLTTIHLHHVPALRQICEAKMITPKLKAIRTRGCWSLRRLPALELEGKRVSLEGRGRDLWGLLDSSGDEEDDIRRPAVEIEKDLWDALEWDGVEFGHHPSLYEVPVHSRYYKRRGLLRGTILR